MLHLGIDYGSKLAGTTAICVKIEGHLDLFQSGKKQDADLFISKIIHQYQPEKVFIDAPLSLEP